MLVKEYSRMIKSMIQTVRVKTKIGPDTRGESLLFEITKRLSKNSIKKIETSRVYRIEGVDFRKAKLLAEKLFCESINQEYILNKPVLHGASYILEISYKPGVMNPEVGSILKAASELGIRLIASSSSTEYGFFGNFKKTDILNIIRQINLYNPTVEYIIKKPPLTLLIKDKRRRDKTVEIRNMSDSELLLLSKDRLYLNLNEMKTIQRYFKKIRRDPTDCELEVLAQTWSEHCAHKTFKATLVVNGKVKAPLIERIKKEALKHNKNIVSAFVDNSGVMDFYEGWAINGKVETHNSPSAIEPYGGASTGSGGVFRDILGTGQGAKTVCSTDIFCFAPPGLSSNKLPQGCLPPDYLLKQVVRGVKDYGNRMGIPTNNGSLHFHDDFRAKPTVIVGAYGILPKSKAEKGFVKKNDVIVAVGGRTGKDGIHGATFSSAEMTDRTQTINSSAVQIGNAIEEKRMFDAILEARDKNLISAIQDCGAGGFSSAIGEMGEKVGATVHLENALLKYQDLSPWEIFLSESQERMVVAVNLKKLDQFLETCKKYNVETSVLGKFDGSKKLKVYYGKTQVCDLDMEFLHHGLPKRKLIANGVASESVKQDAPRVVSGKQWIETVEKIIRHGNICSKEPIVRLYDHTVQGTNSLQPYSGEHMDGPNDAAVLRPLLDKNYGVVISHGLNPVLNNIDPYKGSIWAATEAISNYVAVGGDYKNASLINNYIWPVPDPDTLWSLDRSVDAVCDFMKALSIPVISGKDSLSSTYKSTNEVIKIPPVLCISVFGKISDVRKTVSSDFKKKNSVICLVGAQDINAMGGSVYFDVVGQMIGAVPKINLKLLPKVLESVHKAITAGKVLSCHDVSEGGVFTSIFEMCVGGDIGATVNVPKNVRADYFLFNETAGCFIVEVESEAVSKKMFKSRPYLLIGKTIDEKNIAVKQGSNILFKADMNKLKEKWKEPMKLAFSA